MVSYYNSMYKQNTNFQNSQNPWYPSAAAAATGYHHHQNPQQINAAGGYMPPQEEPSWHHHQPHHHHHHSVFHYQDFPDFVHTGIPPLQPPGGGGEPEHQLPSPPITVSGSEMSSPGGGGGNISPPDSLHQGGGGGGGTRPPPARSPYEWIKKTSYQSQPNPGKTRTKDKYRVVYTDHQRIELEKEFTFVNKYITIRRKSELAATLGLSERQVKIWFQNRRAKERKQNKKRVEEKHQIADLYPTASIVAPASMNHHQMNHNSIMEQRFLDHQQQTMKSETASDIV